jgi:uncharacterized protein
VSARPAARLYEGHVMHMRLIPRRHGFRYRVFTVLVDLDRIEEALRGVRLLRHNRRGAMALMDRDHGARDGSPLRPWVEGELARAGLPLPSRIELLAFPRLLGYVFNPLSVYFCYDAADRLEALVYEVKNTWGDQIAYAVPAGAARGGAHRQVQGKEMAVSPFIGMEQTYRFDVRVPGERLALRIRQAGPEGETLIATISGEARPVRDATLAGAVLRHPMMTLKVIAAIHWEALRLWLKRVPLARDAAAERGDAKQAGAG